MTAPGADWSPPAPAGPPIQAVPPGPPIPAGPPDVPPGLPVVPPGRPVVPPGPLAVPAGPGVQAPFPAPPTDGNRRRLGIGLAIGGAVLLLCCAGGILGARTLVTSSVQAARNQAVKVVTAYLGHWQHEEYAKAYDLLCDDLKQRETVEEFTADLTAGPALESYTVGTAVIESSYVRVPAELTFATEQQSRDYTVVMNPDQTGSICG